MLRALFKRIPLAYRTDHQTILPTNSNIVIHKKQLSSYYPSNCNFNNYCSRKNYNLNKTFRENNLNGNCEAIYNKTSNINDLQQPAIKFTRGNLLNTLVNRHQFIGSMELSKTLYNTCPLLFERRNYSCDCKKKKKKKKRACIKKKPPTCGKPTKCFVPKRVRLEPPKCTPWPPCPRKPEPCIRADDCLTIQPKILPYLPPGCCPCVEPHVPKTAPRIERLFLKFYDPKRVCPKPPCPKPRADDCREEKCKSLPELVPSNCPCILPPIPIDVPLIRLEKKCPPEVCRPKRICPIKECPPRADDGLKVRPKYLRPIEPGNCPCIVRKIYDVPPLRRLYLRFCDPVDEKPECELICPCPRADDDWVDKCRPLPKLKPGKCPCKERKWKNVKFRRLHFECRKDKCLFEDPCCYGNPRADMGCWEYYVDADPAEGCKGCARKAKEKEKEGRQK